MKYKIPMKPIFIILKWLLLCFGLFNAIYDFDEFLNNVKDFSDRSVDTWRWIRDKILSTDWSIDDPIFFWCILSYIVADLTARWWWPPLARIWRKKDSGLGIEQESKLGRLRRTALDVFARVRMSRKEKTLLYQLSYPIYHCNVQIHRSISVNFLAIRNPPVVPAWLSDSTLEVERILKALDIPYPIHPKHPDMKFVTLWLLFLKDIEFARKKRNINQMRRLGEIAHQCSVENLSFNDYTKEVGRRNLDQYSQHMRRDGKN